MMDDSMDFKGHNPSRQLLREFVELKLQQADRESLEALNTQYISKVSALEVMICELAAQIESKDKEIERIQQTAGRASSPHTKPQMSIKEIEARIEQLEKENVKMRPLLKQKAEADRLRLEIEHTSRLKSAYEERCREASMRLVDVDDSLMHDEHQQATDLKRKVEILKHANQDLQQEISKVQDQISELETDRDYFRSDVIPALESSASMHAIKAGQSKQTREQPIVSLLPEKGRSRGYNGQLYEIKQTPTRKDVSGELDSSDDRFAEAFPDENEYDS
jgi:chromosome segregation ATPase